MIGCFGKYRPKIMMDTSEKNRRNRLPQWQSDKMKSLIEDRWSEVWEAVIERERWEHSQQDLINSKYDSC